MYQTLLWMPETDTEANKTDNLLLTCSLHCGARGMGGEVRKCLESLRG